MTGRERKREAKAETGSERPNLRLIADQIRPLPEHVEPSERFRRRMRRRLLALKTWPNGRSAA